MEPTVSSFPMPSDVAPALDRVKAYWLSLKRGGNDMPFSDDVAPSGIAGLEGGVMLVNVFEHPERFRFEIVGTDIVSQYGSPLDGKFSDEVEERAPLELLTQQCAATVVKRTPTYFRSDSEGGYSRILLPTWGDGHVMMLLGAVARL